MLIIVNKVQAESALSIVANRSEYHGVTGFHSTMTFSYFRSLYHVGFKHIKGKPPYSIIRAY